jgi:hypothetical protein
MPKQRPTVASFWVHRPIEHPHAANYPAMLKILQGSCDRLGLRHIVLTDGYTRYDSGLWPGLDAYCVNPLPLPLMQACTEVQALWLENVRDHGGSDTLLVGADCIMLKDPTKTYPRDPALCVTYRQPDARYPINTGAIMVRQHSIGPAAALFRRIAERTGTKWCDDQRALIAELSPMPEVCGVYERAGIKVGFLPVRTFNRLPKSQVDPCRDAVMLHFRGKQHSTGQTRKELLFAWAKAHGYAA